MRLDELNAKILEGLSDEKKRDFEAGLKALNMDNPGDREALRESIKRLRPDFTEAQIDIFVAGEVKPTSEWNLTEAVDEEPEGTFKSKESDRLKALNAGGAKVKGLGGSEPSGGGDREALEASLKRTHPEWTDRQLDYFMRGK